MADSFFYNCCSDSFGFLQYMEGFSNRPKLNRTPNSTLVGIPGEFDGPMN